MKSLQHLLPVDKHDLESIEKLSTLGFPALNDLLPEMLTWIQDMNWPVATPMCLLVAQAGPELIPEIEAILGGDDLGWSYFLITDLLPLLPHDKQNTLIPAVKMLYDRVDDDDIREAASEFIDTVNQKN